MKKLRKPPKGYATWIQLYDAIMKQAPHYLKTGKAPINIHYTGNDGSSEYIKITAGTIERNCWKELQQNRFEYGEAGFIIREIYEKARLTANPEVYRKVCNSLTSLQNTTGYIPTDYHERWALQEEEIESNKIHEKALKKYNESR